MGNGAAFGLREDDETKEKANFGVGIYSNILDSEKLKQKNAYYLQNALDFIYILLGIMWLICLGLMLYDVLVEGGSFTDISAILLYTLSGIIILVFVAELSIFKNGYMDLIKREDDFVTEMNFLLTQQTAGTKFKNSFQEYLKGRFDIKNDKAAENIGKILTTNFNAGDIIKSGMNPVKLNSAMITSWIEDTKEETSLSTLISKFSNYYPALDPAVELNGVYGDKGIKGEDKTAYIEAVEEKAKELFENFKGDIQNKVNKITDPKILQAKFAQYKSTINDLMLKVPRGATDLRAAFTTFSDEIETLTNERDGAIGEENFREDIEKLGDMETFLNRSSELEDLVAFYVKYRKRLNGLAATYGTDKTEAFETKIKRAFNYNFDKLKNKYTKDFENFIDGQQTVNGIDTALRKDIKYINQMYASISGLDADNAEKIKGIIEKIEQMSETRKDTIKTERQRYKDEAAADLEKYEQQAAASDAAIQAVKSAQAHKALEAKMALKNSEQTSGAGYKKSLFDLLTWRKGTKITDTAAFDPVPAGDGGGGGGDDDDDDGDGGVGVGGGGGVGVGDDGGVGVGGGGGGPPDDSDDDEETY